MRKVMLRRAVIAGAVSAAMAGLAVASGGTAQAAEPGKIKVCNGPDFFITVTFPNHSWLTISPGVPEGPLSAEPNAVACKTVTLGGTTNEPFHVHVAPDGPYLGSGIYNGTYGAEVRGIPGPSFTVSS